VETDDIHVALEYKKGDVWGNYVTPRSNRYWLEPSLAELVFCQAVRYFCPAQGRKYFCLAEKATIKNT